MATQKYTTLGQGSLASSYTAGATTITVGTGEGASFPTAGDFVVAIDTGPSFFLKCTSRAGDVLTVATAAVDGTTAANKGAGVAVTEVITKTVLDGIRGDICQSAAQASKPAAEANGILFFPTDNSQMYRDNGSSLLPFGPLRRRTVPPADGTWTVINSGGSFAHSDSNDGVLITEPARSGNNVRMLVKSAPATPYTITAEFEFLMSAADYNLAGLVFRRSATGALLHFGCNQGQIQVVFFSGPTAGASGRGTSLSTGRLFPPLIRTLWRISDDGTNVKFWFSMDGTTFYQYHSQARATDLGAAPDQVGFGLDVNNGTFGVTARLVSWVEA